MEIVLVNQSAAMAKVQAALEAHPGIRFRLSVTPKWLARRVADHELTQQEVNQLFDLRAQYKAQPSRVLALFAEGFSMVEISKAYQLRAEMHEYFGPEDVRAAPSVINFLEFARAFPEIENGGEVSETILELHDIVGSKYIGQSMTQLVAVVKQNQPLGGVASIDAALMVLDPVLLQSTGFVNLQSNGDDDLVEALADGAHEG